MRIGSVNRFWNKVKKTKKCWTWMKGKSHGYGSFKFKGKMVPAHRFSYLKAFGSIERGHAVLHRCDNPPCVRPSHLFIGTLADNVRDCVKKKRNAKGENHGRAKLTEPKVRFIRKNYKRGDGLQMAKKFGVSEQTISAIICRVNWK